MRMKIAHARHDENGNAYGGKAGDQNNEVVVTDWYKHPNDWVILRLTKDVYRAKDIAKAGRYFADNNKVGYDQHNRDSLFKELKKNCFDIYKLSKPVETDCSAMVRACIAYAFKKDLVGDITTVSLPKALVNTGYFTLIEKEKYCNNPNYLKEGDILCTPTKGHTVIVLNNGIDLLEVDKAMNFDSKYIGDYKVKDSVNLRLGATTDSKQLITMPTNTIIMCNGEYNIDYKNNQVWLKVYYKDKAERLVGYCSKKYLTKI